MKDDWEFRLVQCSGTPYEIGLQWGAACKDSIASSSKTSLDRMASFLRVSREQVFAMGMEHLPFIEEYDPYLVDIMRGQAVGAGIPFEEIVTQKSMTDFTCKAMTGVNALCTALAATGKATEGGKTLLGQNIDFLPDATMDFLQVHHGGGLVQYILCINNWTEYTFASTGLGICANATFARSHEFTLPISAYIPRVMRQRNIEDAFDLLKQVARGVAYFHLADGSGRMHGLECTHDDYQIIEPERDVLVHSNHYITERFKGRDTAPGVQPDSYERMETINNLISENYGHITPKTAMEILSNHNHYPNSICRHIDRTAPVSSMTLASFVMVPEEGAIYVARGNPCENGFVRYKF